MKITGSFQITEEAFEELYRAHCHHKYHLRRSMYLSVALLIFGVVMERGYQMDFGWINNMDAVLFVLSVISNVFCDFYLPKAEYKKLCSQKGDHGVVSLDEESLTFGEGSMQISREWKTFDDCIETKQAFLLYQKDTFTILCKEICGEHTDDVRKLLEEKVRKGRPVLLKK